MKNKYITIVALIALVLGAVLVFGISKKAEAPVSQTPSGETGTICTMEAKLCPDGSYVSRSGPQCQFAACPETPVKKIAVKEFTVTGENFSFTPSLITVKKGDRVRIIFKNANGLHNLIIDEFNVATKTIQGGNQDTVEFTADKTGSFQYYCSVGTHRAMGMWGTLKVE